jgi:hypothetical protein
MKLDARPVIDQLTEDVHAAEVEDRLTGLEVAIEDACWWLSAETLERTSQPEWEKGAEQAGDEVWDQLTRFTVTLNSYMSRPA